MHHPQKNQTKQHQTKESQKNPKRQEVKRRAKHTMKYLPTDATSNQLLELINIITLLNYI